MRWQTKVNPPNRDQYLNRCAALRRCLNNVDIMPPFLVVANCLFTLRKALGSDWRVLRWLVLNMAHDRWQDLKERAWWNWHMYVMTRSRSEIQEMIDEELERMTGEDHREWPDVVVDEEPQIGV